MAICLRRNVETPLSMRFILLIVLGFVFLAEIRATRVLFACSLTNLAKKASMGGPASFSKASVSFVLCTILVENGRTRVGAGQESFFLSLPYQTAP